ncbi:polysaccharide deacetylase family protein [Flexithrix dorotheae]|uniref:polysaccharide deacetylase family protein n=1 Tax=Flexithrix dorotheae TaxID=70993 RepID=UPI0003607E87|nr:polysaccharide deacetylase family protein [Flexithrix dorotheae]
MLKLAIPEASIFVVLFFYLLRVPMTPILKHLLWTVICVSPLFFLSCNQKRENQQTTKKFTWPDNKKAAICLTYDDGMQTHLDHAIPQLDSFSLPGTFYLNAVQARDMVVGWKNVATSGNHELANHTLFHPCPADMGWKKEVATDFYTKEKILTEIAGMNTLLTAIEGVDRKRSFAFPCNNTTVGGESYLEDLEKSGLISFARGGGDNTSIITNVANLDPFHVPSWPVPEGSNGATLITHGEKILASEGFGIYQFHGIGGQWISISDAAHISFLTWLKANEDQIWVGTFSEIMTYIQQFK